MCVVKAKEDAYGLVNEGDKVLQGGVGSIVWELTIRILSPRPPPSNLLSLLLPKCVVKFDRPELTGLFTSVPTKKK